MSEPAIQPEQMAAREEDYYALLIRFLAFLDARDLSFQAGMRLAIANLMKEAVSIPVVRERPSQSTKARPGRKPKPIVCDELPGKIFDAKSVADMYGFTANYIRYMIVQDRLIRGKRFYYATQGRAA